MADYKHFHDNHHIVHNDDDYIHDIAPDDDGYNEYDEYDDPADYEHLVTAYDDGTTHHNDYCTAYDDHYDGITVHDDDGRPYVVSRSCPVHDTHHVLRAPASASSTPTTSAGSDDSPRNDDLFNNFYHEFNVHHNHDNDPHNVVAAIDHVNTTDYDNLRPREHDHARNYYDIESDYHYPPPDDYYDHVTYHYYDGADTHLFSTKHNYD